MVEPLAFVTEAFHAILLKARFTEILIKAEQSCNETVLSMDTFRTIFETAGIKYDDKLDFPIFSCKKSWEVRIFRLRHCFLEKD